MTEAGLPLATKGIGRTETVAFMIL